MKRVFLAAADTISAGLGFVAKAMVLILIASMLYEVVARYALGAPTLWAFDIAYMATGVLFVLGAAQALREDAHVRIDFLSSRLPVRLRGLIDGLLYLLVLCPVFGKLAWVAGHPGLARLSDRRGRGGQPLGAADVAVLFGHHDRLAALALQLAAEGIRALASPRQDDTFKLEN